MSEYYSSKSTAYKASGSSNKPQTDSSTYNKYTASYNNEQPDNRKNESWLEETGSTPSYNEQQYEKPSAAFGTSSGWPMEAIEKRVYVRYSKEKGRKFYAQIQFVVQVSADSKTVLQH